MATRDSIRVSGQAVHQTASHAAQGASPLYHNSEPRTIFFPSAFLQRIETRPGALVELLTLALTAYVGKGGAQ